jgi:hypothetical protein
MTSSLAHYKLQGLGSVSEMGDAVLGLVRSRTSENVLYLGFDNHIHGLRPAQRGELKVDPCGP